MTTRNATPTSATRDASRDLAREHDQWAPPSWEDLVRDHTQVVFRLATRLTGNPVDAEDLTQDVFLRAFHALPTLQPGTIDGWLVKITTNLFLDQARRRARVRIDPLSDAVDRMPSSDRGPAHATLDAVLDADVAEALAALTDEQRAAVVLCDIDDMSYSEVAQALGLNLSTVRNHIHRGRNRLRALLAHRATPGRLSLA